MIKNFTENFSSRGEFQASMKELTEFVTKNSGITITRIIAPFYDLTTEQIRSDLALRQGGKEKITDVLKKAKEMVNLIVQEPEKAKKEYYSSVGFRNDEQEMKNRGYTEDEFQKMLDNLSKKFQKTGVTKEEFLEEFNRKIDLGISVGMHFDRKNSQGREVV